MTGSIVGRKSVALLTSWEELCGIAHYSWFLKRALDEYLDIKIVRTPRDILPNACSPGDIQFANRLLDQIVKEVADFDVVCMQFEPNVFSYDPVLALGRRPTNPPELQRLCYRVSLCPAATKSSLALIAL